MSLYAGRDAEFTAQLKAEGVELLNFWRLADTERGHVRKTLQLLQLPAGARVIDLGCGTGRFAALAREERPDLSFTLINTSEAQLASAPAETTAVCRDLVDTGCEDGQFDAVIAAYSFGHAELVPALEEAARLLKVGGKLFLHDLFASTAEATKDLKTALNYDARFVHEAVALARIIGFDVFEIVDDVFFAPGETAAAVFPLIAQLEHGIVVFEKTDRRHVFAGEKKIAFSFSGGKDSLACLELLRPWWNKLTVYWLNPGNPFPETIALMDAVRLEVPHFKEIAGKQREVIAADGWPSDVVPQRYTTDGNLVFGPTPFKVQPRLSCCYRSLMLPLYQAMVEDGITLCFRGKRREEADKTGVESGHISAENVELQFPLLAWTARQVAEYLALHNIELPKSYQHAKHSLDCMDCTAWWGEGLSRYLLAEHPVEFARYWNKITLIKAAVASQMADCEV